MPKPGLLWSEAFCGGKAEIWLGIKSPKRSLHTPRGNTERTQAKQATMGCCCKEEDMKGGSPGRDLGRATHSPSFQTPGDPAGDSPLFLLLWLLIPQGPSTWWEGQGRRERKNLSLERPEPLGTPHMGSYTPRPLT